MTIAVSFELIRKKTSDKSGFPGTNACAVGFSFNA